MSVMSTDASGTPTRSKYDRLIAAAQKVPAVPTLVVHPCDESSLRGAVEAAEAGIIKPILVGPAAKIRETAAKFGLNITGYEIVDAPHSEAAAAKAVEMIHEGKGEALMKGSLHTDELMRSVTAKVGGLRTDRRISHVFIMDVPAYADTVFITDAAINIAPDLDGKRDIIQNVVDLYNLAGFGTTPRVAILSAVETVTSKIPSTIEAAALCKMADRGQITGALLDGPLAFDNAIDVEAARIKGIKSEVAGRAQILIVPDLESGNMLAKNLTYFAKADGAGIVLGARVPIVLTSRADTPRARMASAAVAVLYANARRRNAPIAARVIAMDTILVVNAGSSSVKFQVFAVEGEGGLRRQIKGQMDGIGSRPRLRASGSTGEALVDRAYPIEAVADVPAAMSVAGAWLRELNVNPIAVGHRVVHGGPDYARPVLIDHAVVTRLERYVSLAPLHQPHNLAPIRTLMGNYPSLPQVACFDTAFHRDHDALADHYAIPYQLHADGIRRYGFHGLSYEYISERLPQVAPEIAGGRVIVAHLGSGASMCAIKGGKSVESTMGFTALDGLAMGTRPGQLDPGVVLYLIAEKGMSASNVQNFLYRDCGLKGLSGVSNDMRELETSAEPRAAFAIDYFVYRVGLNAGMLAAALQGLDAFVFTAGIGENSATIRARIAEKLAWLGVVLDPAENARHAGKISRPESRIPVYVVPTDEELMIAQHTLALLMNQSSPNQKRERV